VHKFRDNRLHVFQRKGSKFFYYRWFEAGRYITRSSKTSNLALAKSIAENEYDSARFSKNQPQPNGKRNHYWGEAENLLLKNLELDTRRISRVKTYKIKLGILRQFFSDIPIEQIKTKTIEDYIHWRKTVYKPQRQNFHKNSSPSNKTIHRDLDVLRKILKIALREDWISKLPEVTALTLVANAGGWFSEEEWTTLRKAAKQWIKESQTDEENKERKYLYDFMMFMVHVGCRVDEALCIRYQDCVVAKNNQKYSYITITGGKLAYLMKPTKMVGMFGATTAIRRRKEENPNHQPTDIIFTYSPRDLLVKLLRKTKLLYDDRGQRRSAKCFRHTYIMFRLLRNVDVYKIARNCRTSVKQIENHYGSYINAELSFDELTKMPSKNNILDVNKVDTHD